MHDKSRKQPRRNKSNHNSTTPVYIIYMSINTVNTDLEIKQHWIMQKSFDKDKEK